jgi:RimJ/RimL family protein N-acetyltransferase
MNIYIRRLSEDDWLAFSRIRLTALKTDPTVFGSNYGLESKFSEEDWRNRLNKNDSAIFMLFDDETPIGMTSVSIDREDPTGKTALLWGSWLAPEYRGKGLSDLMYNTRINWAKAQPNVERIIVSHRASNLSSKYANQKHGFVETHKKEKIWTDSATEDEIFYELEVKK